MADGAKIGWIRAIIGGIPALGAFVALAWAFYYIVLPVGTATNGLERLQTLGLFAGTVAIAFVVVAMLRFALAPLLGPDPSQSAGDADAGMRGRIAPLVLAVGSIAMRWR
jgi:hypothetical protein